MTPTSVMIVTAGIVFLSLADHRVDRAQSFGTAPREAELNELLHAGGLDPTSDPGVILALSLPADDAAPVGPEKPLELCRTEEARLAVQEELLETVTLKDPAPVESTLAPEPEAPHRHSLPFDPLREPVLADGTKMQSLIPADAEHTVRYVREVTHEVRSGETLSVVLSKHGLSPQEVVKWLATVRKSYDPNRIYAGQTLSLLLDMPEKRLRRIRFETGKGGLLIIEDTGTSVVARQDKVPHESNVRVVEGEISSSLYEVAIAKGVPDRVISEAAEVLGWEINLGRDLRRGARFRIAYEETMRLDTHESWAGKLLAVELSNAGKQYEGLYYTTPDGRSSGYYNRKGEGLGRQFLRYPVSFARISSHFSTARYHPVLKRKMPHYGVDFAAPTGTPVKAVADGVVSIAGWHGGNGRFVKMRHDPQYESGYAHLSRIASSIKPGTRVKQGQVIGYVGSTGLATGPHLHFAMYKSGKYVDPLQASLPRTVPLTGSALAGFKAQLRRVEQVYAERGLPPFGSTKIATAAATPATRKR